MNDPSSTGKAAARPVDLVKPAEPEQRIGKADVASGKSGKPFADLLARVEQKYPGIEDEVGASSAAVRAGQWIREMRVAKGWTQTQLARKLGWEQERVSNLERGEGTRGPTFDVLHRVATACDYELKFSPRSAPKRASPVKPFGYAGVLRQIGEAFVQAGFAPGVVQSGAAFAASCVSFARLFEHGVQAHAVVEDTEPDKIADVGVGTIPYVELQSHGTRMVTVPVLIDQAGELPAGGAGGLEVKLTVPHKMKIG